MKEVQETICKNILLIVNPVAGMKMARKAAPLIVKLFYQNSCKVTVFTTSEKGEAVNIVRDNCQRAQKIICCGGDGTLNEVITGLAISGYRIPVGYVPTGTFNDLARALGMPVKIKKAIYNVINGVTRKHDIGIFNENQYFAYVASFGAFTKVAYSTPQWIKNLIGKLAYYFNSLLSMADIRPYTVTVIADGKEIKDDFIYGGVSNSTVVGSFIKFPKSEVSFNDGLFEVLLIKNPKNQQDFLNLVNSVLTQQYDERYVYFFKAKEISFVFEKSTDWTIDGEYAGLHNNVNIVNHQCAAELVTGGISGS